MAEGWTDPVAATALASLASVGPRRLARILAGRGPVEAMRHVAEGGAVDGAPAGVLREWASALRTVEPEQLRRDLDRSAIQVTWHGAPGHPSFMADDIDPAPVLFRRGAPIDASLPSVAIVGTRRASGVGREIARELGLGLAQAGVAVVSGLALGVDGAAHEGALLADGAPPVAFVGGGPDVVYPRRHGDLWGRMVDAGTVASEAPPGAPPAPWRFPARNRLIAACADVVVVVESRHAGGSLLTVDEAIRRDRQVMAVPGSLRNPAAAGTNALLADGCAPVRDVGDVLTALGLSGIDQAERRAPSLPTLAVDLSPSASAVLGACGDGPASCDDLVDRTGLGIAVVLAAIAELMAGGCVVDDGARIRRR